MMTTKAAEAYRDEALAKTASNNEDWMDAGMAVIRRLRTGTRWTGEDLRLCLGPRIGKPSHHNAWGALIMKARRSGLLIPTGRLLNMQTPKSHARATMEYVKA